MWVLLITCSILISVDIDNYHDKCHIVICFIDANLIAIYKYIADIVSPS